MRIPSRSLGSSALAALAVTLLGTPSQSQTTHVPSANTKSPGYAPPDVLTPMLEGAHVRLTGVGAGAMSVENPSSIAGIADVTHYGYYGNGPMVASPGALQQQGSFIEASKSEPDKNTYLVLPGLHGPDASYAYRTRFLYQGHESGLKASSGQSAAFLSRINLDADVAHRVTVIATKDVNGQAIPTIHR